MEDGGYCHGSLWKIESATESELVAMQLVLLNKCSSRVMHKLVDEKDPVPELEEFSRQMEEMAI